MSRGNQPAGVPLQIRTATPSSVRAVNRAIMLQLIRRRQPVSRADLARLTGIFRSSVSEIIDELLEQELVAEERAPSVQRGRVPMSLRLNDSGYPVLGLNIRPVYSQLAYAGLKGNIHWTLAFETPRSPKKLVQTIAQHVKQLRKELKSFTPAGFRRMGIAIPGHVDAPSGKILWIPTHKELADFPIAREIEAVTGIEAAADNDCNVGALSELWLSGDDNNTAASDFVFLNVSDYGTGAGAVINGEVYLGHDAHFAAEVGHMVIEPGGNRCQCGRRGCWERYVSNDATWHRLHPKIPFSVERFNKLLHLAAIGDMQALEAFRETARYLSLGISNIGFIFNPAEVIVGGRITAVWNLIRDEVFSLYGSSHVQCPIRPARLSADDSLLHGAVCLALHNTFAKPKFGEVAAREMETA
jgi:predicted NBD/HSP70 family sugar kinase